MFAFYFRIHPWHRISLGGLVYAFVATAILGTLTIEQAIGLPIGATVMWASGWAAIGMWSVVRRNLGQIRTLRNA